MPKTNPEHYKGIFINGVEIQPADVIEAFFRDDGLLSQAAKYMLRHGKKEGNSYTDDVGKSLWWLAKALMHEDACIDLPPGATRNLRVNGSPVTVISKETQEVYE